MKREERLAHVLEIVHAKGSVAVEEVAADLKVSAATIRRDFDTLAKRQLVSRTHGGAVSTGNSIGLPIKYRTAKADSVKQLIAQEAVKYVERYQVIGMNGGTTTTEVARAIAVDPKFSPLEEQRPALTVVTNAVNIASELTVRHQIKIMVTGGVARPQSYELTGPYAEEVLNQVNIDIAFLGVEALNPERGAGAIHEDEARVNKQLAARADRVIVVTDSSKFTKRAFANIVPLADIDLVITDSGIPSNFIDLFRDLEVELVIV